MNKPIILSEVLEMVPKSVSLSYVDYKDNIDFLLFEMQKSISKNNWEFVEEKINEVFMDQQWENKKIILKNIRKQVQCKYELSKSEAKAFIKIHNDIIENKIYENCNDDILRDLERNSNELIWFYDTGYEMESESWSWDNKKITAERQRIKKILKIRGTDVYNARIEMMIRQATYGGQLVIYFKKSFSDLMNNNVNTICFTNPVIAVIDIHGGSGDDCHIDNHQLKLEYNHCNLFIDELIKYNYTYAVCGMSEDWCKATGVTFELNKKLKSIVKDSSINESLNCEANYKENFEKGNCSIGDMDIHRHRNVIYINDYPCGNKCTDCGTFWID